MFKKNNTQVKLGDHFVELGKANMIWEVVGIIDNPYLPPHARIRKLGEEGVHLTSVSALLDNAFFEPTEHKPKKQDPVLTLEQQQDAYEKTS